MAASVELGGECLTEAGDEDVQVLGLVERERKTLVEYVL